MRLEFYKLFKSSLFRIMVITDIIISLVYIGFMCVMVISLGSENTMDLAHALLRGTLAPGPVPSILCGVFVALFLVNEFQSGSIELMISSGTKRTSFISSKFFVCILGGLILYVLHTIIGVGLYITVMGVDGSLSAIGFYPVLRSICLSIIAVGASMALSFFYTILWRKTAGAIITVLAATKVINWSLEKIPVLNNLLNFLPDNMLVHIAIQTDTTQGLFLIVTSIVVVIISLLASYLVFKKCDVKG